MRRIYWPFGESYSRTLTSVLRRRHGIPPHTAFRIRRKAKAPPKHPSLPNSYLRPHFPTLSTLPLMNPRLLLAALLLPLALWRCDVSQGVSKEPTSDKALPNDTTQLSGQLQSPARIAFYNVENLFDTIDHPDKPDEEFTPTGRNKWTTERYNTKLERLAQVIEAMQMPALIGVCEVENEQVLRDLAAQPTLKAASYGVAHIESNDYRGIDNALIYNTKRFSVLRLDHQVLDFPRDITEGKPYSSRDLVHITGILDGNLLVHVFVNHFPSRRGGLTASEPKRVFVAHELRKMVDAVRTQDPNAHIIIMGDFNDETDNKSIRETLGAQPTDGPTAGELVNCFAALDAAGQGSYNYRGDWNMLDQIIVSDNFLAPNAPTRVLLDEATIFQQPWMMYDDKRNGPTPSRTYGGPNYYGGYSDHLPVFIDLN